MRTRIAAPLLLSFVSAIVVEGQTLASANAPRSAGCEVAQGVSCFAFFADGNVRKAIDQEGSGTPASGSIGFTLARYRSVFSGQINIADTPDTVTAGYGARLVAPGVGGALSAGLVSFRRLPSPDSTHGLGYHLYGSIASSRWATDLDPQGAVVKTTDVGVLGFGVLGTWVVARGTVGDDPVFVAIDGGLSYRQLFGDLATKANGALKERLYDTSKEKFIGIETGLILQINSIKAGLNYYFFDGNARGLTDGQVVAGFSIQSNVFVGALKAR